MLEVGITKKTRRSLSECVLVALLPDGRVAVSDSKDGSKEPHFYTREEWIAFIEGVKDGEFDYPVDAHLVAASA